MFTLAARLYDFRGINPAGAAKPHKVKSGGYHTWTDAEIATYREHFPTGTKARLVFEIFLCTGAARQDAAALTRANIRGDKLIYTRGKTGQSANLPMLPSLMKELSLVPPNRLVLITQEGSDRPYKTESLGNWFRDRCNEAGLPQCSAHGLRKAGARLLAENGATENEIAACLGHRSTREASTYTAAANRAKLSDLGMQKLRGKTEHILSNPSRKLDNTGA